MPKTRALALVAAVTATAAFSAVPAQAIDPVDTTALRKATTVNGTLSHERAFQAIANRNGGTRASGTPGYAESVAYVKEKLAAMGSKFTIKQQEFTFPFFRDLSAPTLSQVSPTPTDYETGTMDYSGSGDVTGQLIPVLDNMSPPGPNPSDSNAGCEAADFTPAPAGPAVALIQRGTCTFEIKANNAIAAGYDAVILYNEGQPGRQELLDGTLGNPFTIPVLGISFADGDALNEQANEETVTVNVVADTEIDLNAKTWNLIADYQGGNGEEVVVVGAHLDSVVEGPGINDNGSGSASQLDTALQIAKMKLKPNRKLRFAWWGAEEANLLGSEHYINNLSARGVSRLYANLNYDMVGSPNYVRFVYDGDGSDTPDAGPPGSGAIEEIFTDYFASQNLATKPTAFDGRSDYGPFIAVGIPAGGLFTGAEGIKTAEEAAIFGGTAGVAYDPCYHQACDTMQNLSTKALNEMGDAIAHATWTLTKSESGLFEDGSRASSKRKAVRTKQKGPKSGR